MNNDTSLPPPADWSGQVAACLTAVRQRRPLVHNMTNYVVMNFTANILLSAGASPVMAHAPEEVEEMVSLASALVLNIGTLEHAWVESMLLAGRRASELNIPIVLDPVGAGATAYRTATARKILDSMNVSVIRANPSEILALSGVEAHTKGVDSTAASDMALEAAQHLAASAGAVVAATGETDVVTDGRRTVRVANGHALMGQVTGTGCGATAIVAAFLGTSKNPVDAAAAALAYYGLAGERAAAASKGPGSFVPAFLDELHTLTPAAAGQGSRIWMQDA